MKIFLLSDNPETLMGMRLAGIPGKALSPGGNIREEVESLLSDDELGVLLVTEKLVKLQPQLFKEIRISHSVPLLVEIPDRHGGARGEDFITDHIKNAIGIKI